MANPERGRCAFPGLTAWKGYGLAKHAGVGSYPFAVRALPQFPREPLQRSLARRRPAPRRGKWPQSPAGEHHGRVIPPSPSEAPAQAFSKRQLVST